MQNCPLGANETNNLVTLTSSVHNGSISRDVCHDNHLDSSELCYIKSCCVCQYQPRSLRVIRVFIWPHCGLYLLYLLSNKCFWVPVRTYLHSLSFLTTETAQAVTIPRRRQGQVCEWLKSKIYEWHACHSTKCWSPSRFKSRHTTEVQLGWFWVQIF